MKQRALSMSFLGLGLLGLVVCLGGARARAGISYDAMEALVQTGANGAEKDPSTTYEVVAGDCLYAIAARLLGNGDRWREIYEANKDQIADPNLIYPGQRFVVPGGSGSSSGGGSAPEGDGPASGPSAPSGEASPSRGSTCFNVCLPVKKGQYTGPGAGGVFGAPRDGGSRDHHGVDLSAGTGTPIYATGDGKVIQARWNGGYGYCVKVRHADGTITVYAHLQEGSYKVKEGDDVKAGTHLAGMNNTGHSFGSHLHFEVQPQGGPAVDPKRYFTF